jgi:hypothetical protein
VRSDRVASFLLATAIALGASSLASAVACGPVGAPRSLADAVTRIESALPSVPEVVASPDAKTVLEALDDPPRADAELYRAASRVYGEPLSPDADAVALTSWAARAAAGVRAYGVFVRDDGGRLVAAGAYWVSPLATRLQVVRLDEARIDAGVPDAALLETVGSCLVSVRDWIEIPTSVLDDLLTASDDVQAYLVADGGPGAATQRRWVDGDDLLEAAGFTHPATADLHAFSMWFVGSGPGPVALARAVPRVRSTLGPSDLWTLIRGVR